MKKGYFLMLAILALVNGCAASNMELVYSPNKKWTQCNKENLDQENLFRLEIYGHLNLGAIDGEGPPFIDLFQYIDEVYYLHPGDYVASVSYTDPGYKTLLPVSVRIHARPGESGVMKYKLIKEGGITGKGGLFGPPPDIRIWVDYENSD